MLYVVATPIGNLGDLSPRAVEVLQTVDLIAAEDTRVTQKLLNAFDIRTPLTSCHEHNERTKAAYLVQRMQQEGLHVALTTDAGTPCISDPGSLLTAEAIAAGIEVVAVPGPTAMASALSVSGFPVSEFTFYGFLPRNKKELEQKLLSMARHSQMAVVHESPYRVIALLETLCNLLPGTRVCACCDLTKRHEKCTRGLAPQVLSQLQADEKAEKGEYCLVFWWNPAEIPPEQAPPPPISLEARLFEGILKGLTLRQAMDALLSEGVKKNPLYAASLRVKALLRDEGEP